MISMDGSSSSIRSSATESSKSTSKVSTHPKVSSSWICRSRAKTNVPGTFPFPSTLFEKTARWFERVSASLLESLPCTQGCSDCCVGLFPVTILDRWEIQRGLRSLADEHRKRIERTAAEQIAVLMIAAPQLRTNHFIDQWTEKDIDRVSEQFQRWPCPALEVDGTCGLYEFRPLACRSMGVPQDD